MAKRLFKSRMLEALCALSLVLTIALVLSSLTEEGEAKAVASTHSPSVTIAEVNYDALTAQKVPTRVCALSSSVRMPVPFQIACPPPTYQATCSYAATCDGCPTCDGGYTCLGSPTCDENASTCNGTATCDGSLTCYSTSTCTDATCGGDTCDDYTCANSTCHGGGTCDGSSTCDGSITCAGAGAGPSTCSASDATCDASPTCQGGDTCDTTCTGPTCTGAGTCFGVTCVGNTETCGGYPTCDATCSGETCEGTCESDSTCAGYSTCSGTSTCNATCSGATCDEETCSGYATCTGYPTCGSSTCDATCAGLSTCDSTCDGATCTDETCSGYDTCAGYPTCDTTCAGPTCDEATCGGATCEGTCSGDPTCAGSDTCVGTATCAGTGTCASDTTCDGSSECVGSPTFDGDTCSQATCYSISTCDASVTCGYAATCSEHATCHGIATCDGTSGCGPAILTLNELPNDTWGYFELDPEPVDAYPAGDGYRAVYVTGTEVTTTAMPDDGYVFDHWVEDGQTLANDYPEHTVLLDSNVFLDIYYAAGTMISVQALSGGHVEFEPDYPGGSSSGGYRVETYASGESITLTAVYALGFPFHHWLEWDWSSTDPLFDARPVLPLTVGSEDRSFLAVFEEGYTITATITPDVSPEEPVGWIEFDPDYPGGEVSADQTQYSESYSIDSDVDTPGEQHSVVELTGAARLGYVFDHWEVASASVGTSPYYEATLIDDLAITAHYVSGNTLTMIVDPGENAGGIEVLSPDYPGGEVDGATSQKSFRATDIVEIKGVGSIDESTDIGYVFDHWEVSADDDAQDDPANTLLNNSTSETIQLNMTYDEEVTAFFTAGAILTVIVEGQGSVEVETGTVVSSSAGETEHTERLIYPLNTNLTSVTATAAEGYQFVEWQGEYLSGPTNPASVTVDQNRTIRAVFKAIRTLTVTKEGNGTVEPVEGQDHEYLDGDIAHLKVRADAGWAFSEADSPYTWTEDSLETWEMLYDLEMDEDKSVTVTFVPEISFAVAEATVIESGGALPVDVSITAAPAETAEIGYVAFDGTAENGSDYVLASGTLTFAPTDPLTKQISIQIVDDTDDEDTEGFHIELTTVSFAAIGAQNTHAVAILDDDGPVTLTTNAVPSGAGLITLTPEPDGNGKYAAGALVTIDFIPNQGYWFDHWESTRAELVGIPPTQLRLGVLDATLTAHTIEVYPDLTVSTLSAPAHAKADASLAVTVEVTNLEDRTGSPPSTPWTNTLFLSRDDELDLEAGSTDFELHSWTTDNPIAASGTLDCSTTVTAMPDIAPGTYYLFLYVDSNDNIQEDGMPEVPPDEEENNTSSVQIVVIDPVLTNE